MFIKSFSYSNPETGLVINKTHFNRLNLLVGVSGSGKTRILEALAFLFGVMRGEKPAHAFSAELVFSAGAEAGADYRYIAAAEKLKTDTGFVSETLERGGKTLLDRSSAYIYLGNESGGENEKNKTAVPAPQSLFSLAAGAFPDAAAALNRVNAYDFHFKSEAGINAQLLHKLSGKSGKEALSDAKEAFLRVFPSVQDVAVKSDVSGLGLHIKEGGIWLPPQEISLGMYKTFIHIANFATLPENALVIFDEVENSLGVNCLDFICEELADARPDVQAIFSSHHPYVINNISPENWLIVTREGGLVKALPAEYYHIAPDSGQPFYELMNLLAAKSRI